MALKLDRLKRSTITSALLCIVSRLRYKEISPIVGSPDRRWSTSTQRRHVLTVDRRDCRTQLLRIAPLSALQLIRRKCNRVKLWAWRRKVAVTLAGFAGIVVVFRPESVHQWSALDRFRLSLLLMNSALPLALSMFGMLRLSIEPVPASIWRWCSGVALVVQITAVKAG